jgi:uncharacterized protein (TIGR02271 family)
MRQMASQQSTGREQAMRGNQGRAGAISSDQDQIAIPVVEEELQVGKRQVQKGGIRVHTHVEEKPVEESVTVRDEHINVQRRPVNRAVQPGELDHVDEGTFEISEMDEEVVVNKQVRVAEEVVVGKEVEKRQERVRDTVRNHKGTWQNFKDAVRHGWESMKSERSRPINLSRLCAANP